MLVPMNFALLYPPLVRTALHSPPTGIQQLAWYLRSRGASGQIFDLNLEFCRELTQNDRLDSLLTVLSAPELRARLIGLRAIKESARLDYHATIPLILSVLSECGVALVDDVYLNSHTIANLTEQLCRSRPRLVGLSVICNEQIPYAGALTLILKSLAFDVVWGGPELTGWPRDELRGLFEQYGVDTIVRGDGESGLEGLIRGVPIQHEVIDGVPVPLGKIGVDAAFELDPLAYGQPATLNFIESKGCYWNRCTHCDYISLHETMDNTRRTDVLVDTLNAYSERTNFRRFHFINDTLAPARAKKISAAIAASGTQFRWNSFAKIDKRFDVSILESLPAGGCEFLIVGLESLTDGPLKTLQKGYCAEEATEWIRNALVAGVALVINLIVGIPGSTDEDDLETLQRLREFPQLAGRIKVFRFVLGRNSELGRRAQKEELVPLGSGSFGPSAHRGGSSIAVPPDPALDMREQFFRQSIASLAEDRREVALKRQLVRFLATGELHDTCFSPTLQWTNIPASREGGVASDHATDMLVRFPNSFDFDALVTRGRCTTGQIEMGFPILQQLARSGSLRKKEPKGAQCVALPVS